MGFFSKVFHNPFKGGTKGFLTGALKGGSTYKWFGKEIEDQTREMLGLNALKDLATAQETQLKEQQEANKLDSSIESQNVLQFDDTSNNSFTGSDNRKKKKQAGAYSQALGLQL